MTDGSAPENEVTSTPRDSADAAEDARIAALDDEELKEISGEEERVLTRIVKHLATTKIGGVLGRVDYDADLIALRDQIAEARLEDVPPLIQEMERLQQVAQRRAEVQSGSVDASSPYFGRLVLEEGDRKREVLIGRGTYIEPRTGIRIVDWRDAPVSRIYYRYEEGDDYDENFGGKDVTGFVLTRRSLAIAEGMLRRIVSPQGTFVKRRGAWERLSESARRLRGGAGSADRPTHYHKPGQLGIGRDGDGRADKHLPEIAALIDPRQFELITRPSTGLVVIQGGAGSGKTTIGLHRMAYLAFNEPQRFRADKMLVLVFNAALARYISRVLPALGVGGVLVTTYQKWIEKIRLAHLPRLPRHYTDDTPSYAIRMKKHPAMLKILADAVETIAAKVEKSIGDALPHGAERDAVLDRWKKDARRPIALRLDRLTKYAAGALEGVPAPSVAVRHAVERVSTQLRQETLDVFHVFADVLTDRSLLERGFAEHAPGEFTVSELTAAHAWCVKACMKLSNHVEERAESAERKRGERDGDEGGYDDEDHERHIGIDGRDERDEDKAYLDREDDTLLLRLWQLMRGTLRRGVAGDAKRDPLRYEHILIDEAQDLSPVELAVALGTATDKKSVTLAGDTAQRLLMDNGFNDWKSVLHSVGMDSVTIEPLRVSYRSTHEIIEFADQVLGPLMKEPGNATRHGAPVDLFQFAHSGDAVGFLGEALRELVRAEPNASVCLIARYPEQADLYFRGLQNSEVPHLRRSGEQDFPFKAGIDVTDVRQVKGLEFDYVVLLEVSDAVYPNDAEARHLLHIAATRAAHQLWVTTSGKPSSLLPAELLSRGF